MFAFRRVASSVKGVRFNSIKECREKYFMHNNMGAEHPTYLKVPNDPKFVVAGFTAAAIGLSCVVVGVYRISTNSK